MEANGQSRVAAGRMRAAAAKGIVGAGAVGAFVLFAALARASHASHEHSSGAGTGDLSAPSSFVASLQSGLSSSLDSGQIAPAYGSPQVQSGTS
jgi:hypothetical protein